MVDQSSKRGPEVERIYFVILEMARKFSYYLNTPTKRFFNHIPFLDHLHSFCLIRCLYFCISMFSFSLNLDISCILQLLLMSTPVQFKR